LERSPQHDRFATQQVTVTHAAAWMVGRNGSTTLTPAVVRRTQSKTGA
jgi:hypothetical protein